MILSKSSLLTDTRGNDASYISSATMEASARNESTRIVIKPTGATPARTASIRIELVVLEPRVNGMAMIFPAPN